MLVSRRARKGQRGEVRPRDTQPNQMLRKHLLNEAALPLSLQGGHRWARMQKVGGSSLQRKDAGAKEHGGASTESAGCTDLTWGAGGQAGHREVQAGPGGTEGFPGNQDH